MNIKLKDLKNVTLRLLDHLEKNGVEEIQIDKDFFWNISKDEKYNPYSKPEELDLGQLSDDWNELKKIMERKSEPIGYGLVWLSSLMRVIGEESLY